MYKPNHHPYLETFDSCRDTSVIIESFNHIKNASICWVAHELLDIDCHRALSNQNIQYFIDKAAIVFICVQTSELLAKIHFNKSLNVIEPKAVGVHPVRV